jgi:uncharacterized protein YjdB
MALTLWTAMPLTASADDPVDEATNLTYSISGGEATITGYAGADKAEITTKEIPATVGEENYPVTAVGPQTFVGCVALTEITLAEGQNNFSVEDGILFNEDKTILIRCPAGKIFTDGKYTIPSGVTTFGGNAFHSCASLTSVEIPDTVTIISSAAFVGCSLTSINIPDSVTTIESWAFGFCNDLTEVTIPANVHTIDYCTFFQCTNLAEVTILRDSTMTTLGFNVFYDTADSLKIWCYAGNTTVTSSYATQTTIMIKSIGLDQPSLSLNNSDTQELTVTSVPASGTSGLEIMPAVTWESSNPNLVSVEDGTVTVADSGFGTALITATTTTHSGVKTARVPVTVAPSVGTTYNLTVVGGEFSAANIEGAKMSIVANAAPSGQAFDTWTGIGDSLFTGGTTKNSPSAIFTMPTESVTATATYKTVYALTMVKGTDNLDVGSYAEGDVVSITAGPTPSGQVFDTWTSDPTGVVFTNANSPTTTFAMPGNPVTVTATYTDAPPPPPAPTTYAVTVENGAGSASYEAGTTVSITANAPANGKVFDTWTSNDSVTFADASSLATSFVMPAKAVIVTATYKDDPKDSDGDGVPDYVEEEEGTDPADSCDFKDTDEDGVPDYIEIIDGTDPNDKNSFKDTNSDGIPDYVQEHPEPVTGTNGWVYGDGAWKFFIDSVAQTGWLYDDAWYYLNADGIMQTGWLYDQNDKAWYYLAGNGAMKTGWVRTDGNWYYLKGNGAMVAAKWLHDTDGSWYYLSGNGKMLTGTRNVGGKTYTFKANGVWIG